MNDFLRLMQIDMPQDPDISGAIAGSQPIRGNYMPYYFPNWAAKFYLDGLLLEQDILKEMKVWS